MSGASVAWRSWFKELGVWHAAGLTATLWWRDDDATEASGALLRLRDMTAETGVPLTLSIIPAAVRPTLVTTVGNWRDVTPVQHGFTHTNHAPAGYGQAEFLGSRSLAEMMDDLREGGGIMRELFGERALPILVPPWNRLPPGLASVLTSLGYLGLSVSPGRKPGFAFGHPAIPSHPWLATGLGAGLGAALARLSGRDAANGVSSGPNGSDLVTVGATIDVIDWRRNRFAGEDRVLADMTRHLRRRRLGRGDIDEPTGLLTHHGAMDEDTWDFLKGFLAATSSHPAVRWLEAKAVFRTPGS